MDPLQQLARDTVTRRRLEDQRDGLIVASRQAGHTWRAIAAAAGLTEQATVDAARRATGGELPTPSPSR